MRPSRLFALFLACLLAGCATTAYRAKLPASDLQCSARLESIVPQPLRYAAVVDKDKAPPYIEFADVAQCHARADGNTPLVLYALDGVRPPAEIGVSVLLSTGGTFAASVQVLDANFQLLRSYSFDHFVRRGDEYSLHVFLNNDGPEPAYLLLSPDRAQAGKSDVAVGSHGSPVMIPAGPVMFMYTHGIESNAVRPFLEGGKLRVTARPQGSAAFTSDGK